MQEDDFTTPTKELLSADKAPAPTAAIPNEYGGIYDKPKPRKQGFIEARLNRDNFWNLMFWLGMTINAAFADLFANFIPILALTFFILTLTATPYFLAKFNKVTYTEDKIFLNKKGESLNNRYPKNLPLILVIAIPVSVMLFFAVDKNFPAIKNMTCVYTAIALLCPMLYFILINCPVSILFNKNAWCEEITGVKTKTTFYPTSQQNTSNWSTSLDPYYRHWGGNIHNRTNKN